MRLQNQNPADESPSTRDLPDPAEEILDLTVVVVIALMAMYVTWTITAALTPGLPPLLKTLMTGLAGAAIVATSKTVKSYVREWRNP